MTPEQMEVLKMAAKPNNYSEWVAVLSCVEAIEAHTRVECARVCREMQNGFASDQHIECAEAIERMK